jgi:hypothetical protein
MNTCPTAFANNVFGLQKSIERNIGAVMNHARSNFPSFSDQYITYLK